MSEGNIQVINDTNYSITDRKRPIKKKRHVFGTIIAMIISLLLAMIMRYYVEVSKTSDKPEGNDPEQMVSLTEKGILV